MNIKASFKGTDTSEMFFPVISNDDEIMLHVMYMKLKEGRGDFLLN